MHVVNSVIGKRLQHLVQKTLANIGPPHLRQRQTDVVDSDRHPHVRAQLREQRILVLGMEQGVANRLVGVGQRLQRRRRIDHARSHRQLLEQEFLAARNDSPLRAPIHRHHQIAPRTNFMAKLDGFNFLQLALRTRHSNLGRLLRVVFSLYSPVVAVVRRAVFAGISRSGSPAIAYWSPPQGACDRDLPPPDARVRRETPCRSASPHNPNNRRA